MFSGKTFSVSFNFTNVKQSNPKFLLLKQNERKLRLFTLLSAFFNEALLWGELQENKILFLLSHKMKCISQERHLDLWQLCQAAWVGLDLQPNNFHHHLLDVFSLNCISIPLLLLCSRGQDKQSTPTRSFHIPSFSSGNYQAEIWMWGPWSTQAVTCAPRKHSMVLRVSLTRSAARGWGCCFYSGRAISQKYRCPHQVNTSTAPAGLTFISTAASKINISVKKSFLK